MHMEKEAILRLLRRSCLAAGSQNKWAKAHGVSQAYVSQVLTGRRHPSPLILSALGLERRITRTRKHAEWRP
jgi:DNA-binding transcriptional regulator YdaS (Cro superfamily)